ncbi:MAG: hypothetical protein DRN17_08425 [Thermoplasmata archaeon]|nr:MAG: hypothetical protein DRN17_08425 [Thermoplasmata archaeon]
MSVTAIHLPFKKDFEPIVRMEENIAIPKTAGQYSFFKVLYIEPLQPYTTVVSLDAYERNKEKTLDEVKLEENEVGQWRLWIPDYVAVDFYHPRAARKWVTKEANTSATPLSMAKEQVLEFYTYKDSVPRLLLSNPIAEEQYARLIIWGFKYLIEPLKEKPKDYTPLPAYSAVYVVGGAGR